MTIVLIGLVVAVFALISWIISSFKRDKTVTEQWQKDHIYRWGKGEF